MTDVPVTSGCLGISYRMSIVLTVYGTPGPRELRERVQLEMSNTYQIAGELSGVGPMM